MRILDGFSAASISEAATSLSDGALVGIPTETVYGLAADASNDAAVAKVFDVKGRPRFNPLIIHVRSIEHARQYVGFSPLAQALASEFWPGPLTLILDRKKDAAISNLASAGLNTLAVRVSSHPVMQSLMNAFEGPVAAPSANPSGSISPTRAEHVRDGLGAHIGLILDGGPCLVGLESTIVSITNDSVQILRPGGISAAAIAEVIGVDETSFEKSASSVASAPVKFAAAPSPSANVIAPGMLKSHYAPTAPLRINISDPESDEVYLSFGGCPTNHSNTLSLSDEGSDKEAAANLFVCLRLADTLCLERKLCGIAVAPIPMQGLGEAINDRLQRAAAPRGFDPIDARLNDNQVK
ncbi:MAG: L-threonylcarbamoyladenylate synthase [Pseudomonadota bacterium]